MKETEQTLFLKSNLLHIRLKEGEYEVSNPETAGIMQNGKFFLWHTDSNGGYKHTESEGVDCEWPGKVELIKQRGAINLTVARLLPEEKKSESAYKEGERCTSQICGDHSDHLRGEGRCEAKPVSAPSESQEELWNIIIERFELDNFGDGFDRKQFKSFLSQFTITRKPE